MKPIAELFNLTGQTAIVTGGAMGIGQGIVQRLHEAGANVIIADVAEPKSLTDNEFYIKTDISDETSIKNLVTAVQKQFGRIDILVNNAGIFPQQPVLAMELSFWEKIQAVNLRGTFLCCREVGNVMAKQGRGNIVNIASIDALHPSMAGLAAYDASKHAVWGFTKNFALEVGKLGIRVNAIAPGSINTEGVKNLNSGAVPAGVDMTAIMKQFLAKIPLGRMGEPDDIAMATLFLASAASSYMTGSMMVVDGGVLLS
ncbi:MAG: SDR family NAD(P)-dependent oxidoreductase [Patescibacteria group bacterium]